MKYQRRLVYSILLTGVALVGCINSPSANQNSSIDGNIVGEWRLKTEGTGAFDEILRLSITENGKFTKLDSSCFVGASANGDPCTIKYRWSGSYKITESTLVLFRKIDTSDVLPTVNMVRDTMEYSLRRLDNDALVIVYKFTSSQGSDSTTEGYYRIK